MNAWCKKYQDFSGNISSINFVGLYPFSSNFQFDNINQVLKVFFCEKVLKGLTLIALWCAVPSHFFLCAVRVLSCKTVENVMCILAAKNPSYQWNSGGDALPSNEREKKTC